MKFDFFNERTPPVIGVDVSSSAVKMVELSMGKEGRYNLVSYAIVPLPKDAVVEGNIANLEQVGETVKRAWKILGTRERRAALALPSSAVISKKVMMQAGLREEDMELQVEAEANQYIPFALDEVNIDFQVIGPTPNNPEDVDVLIAAARKENIEDRVAAAETAGLKVLVMDAENYATEAAYMLSASQLPDSGHELTVMLVDIGATMLHIHVFYDNQSVYSREQGFGGNQLTEVIQQRFGLSQEEAEIAKRKGGLPESYDAEILQPFLQSLAVEVGRAIQFFTSSTQYGRVNHILLAGGGADLPGLVRLVAEQTQVSTLVANPFASMAVNRKIKDAQLVSDAPCLMIACGLALRSFG